MLPRKARVLLREPMRTECRWLVALIMHAQRTVKVIPCTVFHKPVFCRMTTTETKFSSRHAASAVFSETDDAGVT